MATTGSNQILFLAEDAMSAVLTTAVSGLTLPIHLSASADTLEPPCIAIRAEQAEQRPSLKANYGVRCTVELRTNPHSTATPRATLRNYVAVVGDALDTVELATSLSTAISAFACDGAQVERVSQQADGLHHLYGWDVLLVCRASD
jgi:hypothetical protein